MWMEPLWKYKGADHSFKGPFSLWQFWQWYHIGHLYGCLKVFIKNSKYVQNLYSKIIINNRIHQKILLVVYMYNYIRKSLFIYVYI